MIKMSVVDINKAFYNKLYRKRSPLVSLVYSLISFDQQSKSKVNYKVIKGILKERINKDLAVLDYGFGHGSLLLKYRHNHRLFGCDISEEAVQNFPAVAKLAGKKVSTATVEQFDARYGQAEFDVITLSHIIEHVDDDLSLVKSLSGKLSAEGVILINIPINEVWQDPKHVRKYDYSYIESLTDKCGLKIISQVEADKLTSFFLTEEKTKNGGTIKVYVLKCVRLLFAILPLWFVRLCERTFLRKHSNQQLIVVAKKR